jgi:hypothetical protein
MVIFFKCLFRFSSGSSHSSSCLRRSPRSPRRASPRLDCLVLPRRCHVVGVSPITTLICPHLPVPALLGPAPCSHEPVAALAVPVPPALCSCEPVAAVLLDFSPVSMFSLQVSVLLPPPLGLVLVSSSPLIVAGSLALVAGFLATAGTLPATASPQSATACPELATMYLAPYLRPLPCLVRGPPRAVRHLPLLRSRTLRTASADWFGVRVSEAARLLFLPLLPSPPRMV